MGTRDSLDRLFFSFRIWGGLSVCLFVLMLLVLALLKTGSASGVRPVAATLVIGFLWIGATSLSRHAFVSLRRRLGKGVTSWEFLATQFMALLFPYFFLTLRREIEEYRERGSR